MVDRDRRNINTFAVGASLVLFLLAGGLAGDDSAPAAVYTLAQAEAGRVAYANTCGQCHTPTLLGRKGDPAEIPPLSSLSPGWQKFIATSRGVVPPLAGQAFRERWGSKTLARLISRLQEAVPAFPPEGMNDDTTVNIAAYVLQVNGAKAGNRPLTRTTPDLLNSLMGDPPNR